MKRKITFLFLAAMLIAVTGLAQGKQQSRPMPQKHLETLAKTVGTEMKAQPSLASLQRQHSADRQKMARVSFTTNQKMKGAELFNAPWRNARRAAGDDIIVDQPEGRQVLYSRSGSAYFYYWGYVFNTTVADAVGNVVFGEGNTVYVKNLLTQYTTNSWTKGTINGSTIVFDFPQKALNSQGYDYFLNYGALSEDLEFTPGGSLTMKYDAETGEISPLDEAFVTGEKVIALVDGDNLWTGYADWDMSYAVVTDEQVQAPEGIETAPYSLTASGYDGSIVKVGFTSDAVYVQGIDANLPDTWVKGAIEGNKVIFKSGQYIGADEVSGYHQYLYAATSTQEYDPYYDEYNTVYTLVDDDIVFTYDAETKTLESNSLFLINAGKTTVSYLNVFENAKIAPFVETAATPATPEITDFYEGGTSYYMSGYGWGYITAKVLTSDVDGNYILPEKLSYALWVKVNGEEKQLTLSWNDYMYQEVETLSELPFGYNDTWDIYASGLEQTVYYYVIGPEAYGVQAIYRGLGEERRSEIAWAEVTGIGADVQPAAATPAYPDVDPSDVGGQIDYGFYTGEEQLSVVSNNAKAETYDVAIKLQNEALVGSHIESITIPMQTKDGISNVSVWLSSQLRVENGKNVPDLVSKSVELTEAGFVTVKLDKPYIIPAEGVYVGYSFTIDDVSVTENQSPVAITNQVNEGGFYMHTSDGFLKWIDATDIYGGSAALTVTVAGKLIKSNAVSMADLPAQYVMTNSEISLPVSVVNHGSEGVKSIDIEYTLAGKTASQHIDVEPAVSGFFGKTATVVVSLPALAESGTYVVDMKVTKVNGVDNEDPNNANGYKIVALNTVPKHRVLLEEYTGLWCGWCPRGFVALEKLASLYPDDYVLVSYHNGDDMEIMASSDFPSSVAGFPSAYIERKTEVDPYYGTTQSTPLGVANDMAAEAENFGVATIDMTPSFAVNGNAVSVATKVTFPFDVEDGAYALEYILVSDGLNDASWGQSNNYAGTQDDDDLALFTQGESTVYGLTFNDVAVLTSQIGGIAGSIPANVKADQPVSHTYTFSLAKAVNTNGANVIQDKNNLKVVALLIDTQTGAVLNAVKAKVGESTGIDELNGNSRSVQTVYYDLSGRKVFKPANGVFIKSVRTGDGQTKSEKVIMK